MRISKNSEVDHQPLAHVTRDGRRHLLADHLRAVAARSAEHARPFAGSEWARAAGLWHDLGKYAADFQEMISTAGGEDAHVEGAERSAPKARRVDHSTAGAALCRQNRSDGALLVAFAIAGHHAGLPDFVRLRDRLADRGAARLDAALRSNPPDDVLAGRVPDLPAQIASSSRNPDQVRRFDLLARMVFSSLCDADFIDTEAFFDGQRAGLRGGHLGLRALASRLASHVDGLTRSDTEVNRVRAEVRRDCLAAAERQPGLFTLTVPTGGGKTLAAMEFALRHSLHHCLRRVIVAIPYTSIIEQNADVYRRAFGLDRDDVSVLEHHSAFDLQRETPRSRIAAENWDPPVIVTTNVQLLESLFARRTSTCRKLHNIPRSVIILDEAQTLPRGLLAPTTDVLSALAADYGCSVVLCTATQPALTRDVLRDCGLERPFEIIPDPPALACRLRRVEADWSLCAAAVTWPELAARVATEPDVLAIVHQRADARALCAALDALVGDTATVHLSALMCPAHRTEAIASIRDLKHKGRPVRVVSTQLIEAGVDLDFPVVFRALGGLDSLTQSAGRCNREGRLGHPGLLRVYRAPSQPPRGILEQGLLHADNMLRARPDLDLFSPSVHADYFERLYNSGGDDRHDETGVQRLRAQLKFEQVAESYRLIDDDWSTPLVIPFDARAERDIAALDHAGPSRNRLRALARVTVNVNRRDLHAWLRSGLVRSAGDETANVLIGAAAYDRDRFGLVPELVGALPPNLSVI